VRPPRLELDDLRVSVLVDGQPEVPILHGLSLSVGPGEVHAIMGPNGSGKSTLANTLLASPDYRVTGGRILLDGEDVTRLGPPDRARRGLFLGFQYPEEIPGVTVLNFLRQALSARKGFDVSVLEVRVALMEWSKRLEIDDAFLTRYLNEGFSGGEKKRNEILQLALLEPEVAVLDETDSGLDIDALRVVAGGLQEVRRARPEMGVVLITHYHRLLDHVAPDVVHVLIDGRIVESGGPDLARAVEREGYEARRDASAA
jgi:Fe-S cluster assembly ATP-binding protein